MLGILTTIPQNTATNSNAFILKTKNIQGKFYSIFRNYITFWSVSENLEHHTFSIFEIIESEKLRYFNA